MLRWRQFPRVPAPAKTLVCWQRPRHTIPQKHKNTVLAGTRLGGTSPCAGSTLAGPDNDGIIHTPSEFAGMLEKTVDNVERKDPSSFAICHYLPLSRNCLTKYEHVRNWQVTFGAAKQSINPHLRAESDHPTNA